MPGGMHEALGMFMFRGLVRDECNFHLEMFQILRVYQVLFRLFSRFCFCLILGQYMTHNYFGRPYRLKTHAPPSPSFTRNEARHFA